MTGVHVFDAFVEDGNIWLKAVMERLSTDDATAGLAALRAALHALRDRLPPESAVHLGAQLPTLIRGIFFENWHMAGTPTKERHLGPFLDHLAHRLPRGLKLSAEEAARAVFAVVCDQVDHGEIAKVLNLMPHELRDLWPVLAQVDAADGS